MKFSERIGAAFAQLAARNAAPVPSRNATVVVRAPFSSRALAPRINLTPRLSIPPLTLKKFQKESGVTRSYAGANYDRLTEDFLGPLTTGDAEMRTRIRTLRQRARELERNEPYSGRFLTRLEDNIYDHHGMAFESLAGEWKAKGGETAFVLDKADARTIDRAYAEWKKNPFVTKDMTLNEGGRLALRSAARDGDVFTKWIVDPSVNDFGFALQLLEADMCDDLKNDMVRGPNNRVVSQVRMGVEVDPFFRTTGYWMLKEHPGDQQWWQVDGYQSAQHPASEFLHSFRRRRITQVRDVTWLCSIMRDLKMLDGYDEAAIVAARTGAAKMGFLTRAYNEAGPPYTGDDASDDAMGGEKAMDAEPGLIEDLSQSPGLKFEKWDPAYPHEQYDAFMKVRLRRIGAGVDTSYYAIANDLTEVNFSSIRAGLLEDREHFKALQSWWIARYEDPIFMKWLEVSLMLGTIRDPVTGASLPFSKLKKFENHNFRPRRWPWVDPEKDVNAAKIAIDNRLKSRTEVIAENSQTTFPDVIEEQRIEQEIADKAGVVLPAIQAEGGGGDSSHPKDPSGHFTTKPKPAQKD